MVWGHFPRITQCKERNFDGNLFECCLVTSAFGRIAAAASLLKKSMSWFCDLWGETIPPFSQTLEPLLSLRGRDARCGFAGFCQQAGPDGFHPFFGGEPSQPSETCALNMFQGACLEKWGGFPSKSFIYISQVVARRRLTVFLKMWDEFFDLQHIKKSKLFVDGFRNLAITTWDGAETLWIMG